jgi:hypothetical protein
MDGLLMRDRKTQTCEQADNELMDGLLMRDRTQTCGQADMN